MSLEEIKKIARSLKNNNFLLITGGEPFLRDDLPQIIKVFYEQGRMKKVRIVTNGYLTDKIISTVENILQDINIVLTIQVSLDAVGREHDALRGLDGLFTQSEQTIKHLNHLKQYHKKLKVSVNATVTNSNYDKLILLDKYVKEQFDLELGWVLVREPGVGIYNLDNSFRAEFLSLEEDCKLPNYDNVKNILSNTYISCQSKSNNFIKDFSTLEKKYEFDIIFKSKRPPFRCLAGITDIVIYPTGGVSFCEMTKPFADLKNYDYDLYELWRSQQAQRARDRIGSCFCMHPCHLISAMKHNANILLDMTNSNQ